MHKCLIFFTVLLTFVVGHASPTLAKWGCGTTGQSSSWGYGNQAGARAGALRMCQGQCSIMSCSPHVDTEAEANALWPSSIFGSVYSGRQCGRVGQPKC